MLKIMRHSIEALGLCAFPAAIALVYVLYAYGWPRLSQPVQHAIEHGMAGMLIGIFGGALFLGAAYATMQSIKSIAAKAK